MSKNYNPANAAKPFNYHARPAFYELPDDESLADDDSADESQADDTGENDDE